MSRHGMKHYRVKNPHWTPEQEQEIARAERFNTRAFINELGAAEFLKGQYGLTTDNLEEVREALADAVSLRKRSAEIHESLRPSPRTSKKKTAPKARPKHKPLPKRKQESPFNKIV